MYLIVIGTIKSYGILYTELDEYYNVGSGPVALIGSLFLGCLFGLGKWFISYKYIHRRSSMDGCYLIKRTSLNYLNQSHDNNQLGLEFSTR